MLKHGVISGPGEGFPKESDYVLVEYALDGGYTARGLASRTEGRPFYRPDPLIDADQEVAIQKAVMGAVWQILIPPLSRPPEIEGP
jgi:hypothetical protein